MDKWVCIKPLRLLNNAVLGATAGGAKNWADKQTWGCCDSKRQDMIWKFTTTIKANSNQIYFDV